MKCLLGILIIVGTCGCNQSKNSSLTLVRTFKNTGNWDSVYLYSDGHLLIKEKQIPKRFFYFSYSTCQVNNGFSTVEGFQYIASDYFPRKTFLDSLVFDRLPLKRKCYQNVIITSIFEFESEADYLSFSTNVVDGKSIKNKKNCE